jgi:hypothetical protein
VPGGHTPVEAQIAAAAPRTLSTVLVMDPPGAGVGPGRGGAGLGGLGRGSGIGLGNGNGIGGAPGNGGAKSGLTWTRSRAPALGLDFERGVYGRGLTTASPSTVPTEGLA